MNSPEKRSHASASAVRSTGKTAIVDAITPRLLDLGIKVLIITNDVVTTEDAQQVQRTLKGILLQERILGVEMGACPHTAVREDPSMNLAAVEDMEASLPDSDVVLIQSGGDNLTLTFSPALVDYFIYVIDVAAGDKIHARTAPASRQLGCAGHQQDRTWSAPLGASLDVMKRNSLLMRGSKPFLFTNCKSGEGIPELVALIEPGSCSTSSRKSGAAHDGGSFRALGIRGSARRLAPDSLPAFTSTAADEERHRRQDRFLRLGFERRASRTILADLGGAAPLHGATCTSTRRCDAGSRLRVPDHHHGMPVQGSQLRPRHCSLASARRRTSPRNRPPRSTPYGRQLRRADANHSLADDAYLRFCPIP